MPVSGEPVCGKRPNFNRLFLLKTVLGVPLSGSFSCFDEAFSPVAIRAVRLGGPCNLVILGWRLRKPELLSLFLPIEGDSRYQPIERQNKTS